MISDTPASEKRGRRGGGFTDKQTAAAGEYEYHSLYERNVSDWGENRGGEGTGEGSSGGAATQP